MHTIWMREHNRIADELHKLNPKWNDEELFQEARRIVIAEYQHIIYNEWLPLIIGPTGMTRIGMTPIKSGYSKYYSGKKKVKFLFEYVNVPDT